MFWQIDVLQRTAPTIAIYNSRRVGVVPLSRVYTSATCCAATCCAQHVACCRQQNCCADEQHVVGNKQLVARLLPATCCSSAQLVAAQHCCAGVNAALVCRESWCQSSRTDRWAGTTHTPRDVAMKRRELWIPTLLRPPILDEKWRWPN